MADIGKPIKQPTIEPIQVPSTPAPEREPVTVPSEPEKVPA